MKKNEELFEVQKKDDEELLDFEFDELSEEDLEAASGESVSDDEIIELDDIVETGEFAQGTESEEITKVLDEEMMGEEPVSSDAELNGASGELDVDDEPAALDSAEMDISDTGHMSKPSESDEIASLLDADEAPEEPEATEVISDLASSDSDEPFETDTSEDLAAEIEAEFEGLDTSEEDILDSGDLGEDSEFEETLRLPDDAEAMEETSSAELESDLSLDDLDEPLESDVSKDLSDALEAEFEGLETSEIDMFEVEEPAQGSETDEISRLLAAEDAIEDRVDDGEGEASASGEREAPEGADSSQVVEMQLDAALESLEASEKPVPELELSESETESVPDADAFDESIFESDDLEEAEISDDLNLEEPGAEAVPILPHEDLSKGLEAPDEQVGMGEMMAAPAAAVAISEEKIEEIITRVVEDVVERVGRETMANVAEKLITEAIDALKESLEATKD